MEKEKRLLLLQLKSDLKDVLNLTREKSRELVSAMYRDEHSLEETIGDLEYHLSSLLDIAKEIRKLVESENFPGEFVPYYINVDSPEFDVLLGKLSNSRDMDGLMEILAVLEDKEHYELCAKVNQRIRDFGEKPFQPR